MIGFASALSTAEVCSFPLTPCVKTEPARTPMESVASRTKVVVSLWLRMPSSRLGAVGFNGSMGGCFLFPVAEPPAPLEGIVRAGW